MPKIYDLKFSYGRAITSDTHALTVGYCSEQMTHFCSKRFDHSGHN